MNNWKVAWGLATKPIIIAFVLIALRFVAEALEWPNWAANIFGVSWLVFLLPIYFALEILKSKREKPFLLLVQTTLVFALPVRLVVAASYSLAYHFQWQASRFQIASGGVVPGPNDDPMTPLQGYLAVPAANFLFGVITAVAIAAIIGGIIILVKGKKSETAEAGD